PLQTCVAAGFTPTGACKDQVAAALESTQFSSADSYFGDLCLANGAAFFLYDWCDLNCCSSECLGAPFDGDASFCNAPGSGGGGGSGAAGTGGSGAAGSTGAAGSSGAAGTAGTAGRGGSAGTGAAGTGAAGSAGGAAGGP